MSIQSLSPRSVRRIARITGLPVQAAWGHGTYVHSFVTDGHRHWWFDLKNRTWGRDQGKIYHTNVCRRLFGD
jgi:hypothetical protein